MGFNPRGQKISDSDEISPLIILNEDVPTRLPSNGSPSSPDITMASAHVALASTRATYVSMNSDHLPITISLPSKQASPHHSQKTFTNFNKADWPMFVQLTETVFRSALQLQSCSTGVKIFNNILRSASKKAILAGFRHDFLPGISRARSFDFAYHPNYNQFHSIIIFYRALGQFCHESSQTLKGSSTVSPQFSTSFYSKIDFDLILH
jgi:hypothetical protein